MDDTKRERLKHMLGLHEQGFSKRQVKQIFKAMKVPVRPKQFNDMWSRLETEGLIV